MAALPENPLPNDAKNTPEQLVKVKTNERLIPLEYKYTVMDTAREMLNTVDHTLPYPGYPVSGLTMTDKEYNQWVSEGRPIERLIGNPEKRPEYFIEYHENRYNPDGNLKNPIVVPYDGMTYINNPNIPDKEKASDGSPLHPFLRLLLTRSQKGLATGPGFYWDVGPMYTADGIVLRIHNQKLEVLLVNRSDVGVWALPGGHVDKLHFNINGNNYARNETPLRTAMREIEEETGVTGLEAVCTQLILLKVPVADPRMTAQSWPVTTVLLFMPNPNLSEIMEPKAGSDALKAGWHPVGGDQMWPGINASPLFASHNSYLKLAIRTWEMQTGFSVRLDSKIGLPDKI